LVLAQFMSGVAVDASTFHSKPKRLTCNTNGKLSTKPSGECAGMAAVQFSHMSASDAIKKCRMHSIARDTQQ